MVLFYKTWKKYNEIQLTKKMDLNNRKMTNNPYSPKEDSSTTPFGTKIMKKIQILI